MTMREVKAPEKGGKAGLMQINNKSGMF